jgi:hypothetical protein
MEIGKRLEEELADSEPDVPVKTEETSSATVESKAGKIVFNSGVGRSLRLTRAYLAEGLVFQALQAELGGSIQRDVTIAGLHVEGLVYSPDGTITVVEVKIVSASSPEWRRQVREARQYLENAKLAFQAEGPGRLRLLLALVVDGNFGRLAEVRSEIPTSEGLDIRVYGMHELIQRYGFGDEDVPKRT